MDRVDRPMWRASLARVFLLAALLATPGAAASPGQESLPAPIATRQTLFAIPFRIDPNHPKAVTPQAVQLYVSTDRGATWQFHSSVEPGKGSFLFRGGDDGEYWFSIHTVDAAGQVHPKGPTRPGLRVLVDTTPPRLQLEAWRGGAGELVARWQIIDRNLNPDSLKIEYRTGKGPTWQTVAVDPRTPRSSGPVVTGEVSWFPAGPVDQVEVRAEVADAAGNNSVSQAQVAADRSLGPPPKPIPNDDPLSIGGRNRPGPAIPGRGPNQPPPFYPSDPAKANLTGPALGSPSGSALGSPSGSAPGTPSGPAPPDSPAGSQALFRMPDGTVAIQIHPAIRNQYTPSGGSGPVPRDGLPPGGLPPGQRVRVVSSLQFQLEYDVESVGPSGIARVELWGTRDGGRTWTSFGLDDDRQSPFLVRVKEEGTYGFRVAVQSGAGLGDEPPQSGATAQVWIGVDLTRPIARILSAEQLTGARAGQVLICWQAEDWMLAARPVSLYYSPSRDGPWSPIAADLEDTGQYTWSLDNRIGEQIFLRLEARDEAGNVGIYETPQPIFLDQRRPQVRIRDVCPLE